MYGIVNQAIEDLVKSNLGEGAWHEVLQAAGVKELEFVGNKDYSDELTFKLVGGACEVFMQPPEILLRLFGRHWIMFTGREGWHEFFDVSCTDVIGFLMQLDAMHKRVINAMPGAKPPKITLRELSDRYELDYESDREGLVLFFEGIIEGLAEYYDEPWVVNQIQTKAEDGIDRFELKLVSSVLNDQRKQHVG